MKIFELEDDDEAPPEKLVEDLAPESLYSDGEGVSIIRRRSGELVTLLPRPGKDGTKEQVFERCFRAAVMRQVVQEGGGISIEVIDEIDCLEGLLSQSDSPPRMPDGFGEYLEVLKNFTDNVRFHNPQWPEFALANLVRVAAIASHIAEVVAPEDGGIMTRHWPNLHRACSPKDAAIFLTDAAAVLLEEWHQLQRQDNLVVWNEKPTISYVERMKEKEKSYLGLSSILECACPYCKNAKEEAEEREKLASLIAENLKTALVDLVDRIVSAAGDVDDINKIEEIL